MLDDHNGNKGFSLLELIIAITIMAIIVGIITPQYMKYVYKARKATDMQTAARLGDIFTRSLVEFPEAYASYDKYEKLKVKVKVNGSNEKPYDVYLIMVNEDKFRYWFYGGSSMTEFFWKSDDNIGLYNYVNQELGFEGVMRGANPDWTRVRENTAMMPQYKTAPKTDAGKGGTIDRWRIVKRVDNGAFEIWSACDYKDGKSYGGKPCYRAWPNPDDIYTK